MRGMRARASLYYGLSVSRSMCVGLGAANTHTDRQTDTNIHQAFGKLPPVRGEFFQSVSLKTAAAAAAAARG